MPLTGELDPRLVNFDVDLPITGSRRKQVAGKDNTFAFSYGESPSEAQLGLMATKMMEQACYAAQYRLKDIDRYILKYEQDHRFRIAYAFEQLADWQAELLVMYSYVSNATRAAPDQFRVLQHIRHFTHAVRKMVDVTYTVEHILHLTNVSKHKIMNLMDMPT